MKTSLATRARHARSLAAGMLAARLTVREACAHLSGSGSEMRTEADERESDAQLIEAIAGGDQRALASLYDRYAPPLLAAGRRTLRSQRDAEDVLHDVFVEVWQQAAEYDERRGTVKAWLFLRMRSRAIDRLRLASAKEVELDGKLLSALPAQPAEDPSLAPDRSLVRNALLDLPPDQRLALELAYFAGLSGSQIAERLGAPLGTIKTRLALGMSKLRAAFLAGTEVGE
jgi:RNA polymerase sigma-70 factor (ECF subfamily)